MQHSRYLLRAAINPVVAFNALTGVTLSNRAEGACLVEG